MKSETLQEASLRLPKFPTKPEARKAPVVRENDGPACGGIHENELENPVENKVDWESWAVEQEKWLKTARKLEANPVLEDRNLAHW